MSKILCPGEAVIDFVASEALGNLEDSLEFIKKAGGAPANAAGAMVKLKADAYFMGTVGDDPFGNFLKQTMENYQINTTFLKQVKDAPTTLAFVSLTADGERDFVFNRGADACLKVDDTIDLSIFDCFHFASATAFLGGELECSYDYLLKYASEHKKLVTFDANYRDALFATNTSKFISSCKRYIAQSDIVKLSEEEAILISGESDLLTAGRTLQQLGGKYLLITLGAKGTYLFHNEGYEHIPSIKVTMVDSTGAGDAFIGTVVALAVKEEKLTVDKMKEIVLIANKVGALTTENYGALQSIPDLEVVKN